MFYDMWPAYAPLVQFQPGYPLSRSDPAHPSAVLGVCSVSLGSNLAMPPPHRLLFSGLLLPPSQILSSSSAGIGSQLTSPAESLLWQEEYDPWLLAAQATGPGLLSNLGACYLGAHRVRGKQKSVIHPFCADKQWACLCRVPLLPCHRLTPAHPPATLDPVASLGWTSVMLTPMQPPQHSLRLPMQGVPQWTPLGRHPWTKVRPTAETAPLRATQGLGLTQARILQNVGPQRHHLRRLLPGTVAACGSSWHASTACRWAAESRSRGVLSCVQDPPSLSGRLAPDPEASVKECGMSVRS
jgi:hypothetical protein